MLFIAALFVTAKYWGKNPEFPYIEDWLTQLWYIYIMEYYVAVK